MNEANELPQGWVWTTLGEVLPIQYGKGLVVAHRETDGQFPVYGSSGIVGFHSQALTTHATLIIGRKGSVGSVYYSPIPCWPIDTTYFVEECFGINLQFFLYLLSTLGLSRLDKSTAIPGLSRDDYNALYVNIAPLLEQQRIVAAIEEQFTILDASAATLRQNRARLKQARASVLKYAVEGQLTEAWRAEHPTLETADELLKRILKERRAKWDAEQLEKMRARGVEPEDEKWKQAYKEPQGPDVESLPELPEGWCWATVEQLAAAEKYSLAIGPFGSNLKVEDYRNYGVPLVFVRNIRSGIFDDSSNRYISERKASELRAHQVVGGDILITKMGDPPGDACLYPYTRPPAVITADCIKWTLSPFLKKNLYFVNTINSSLVHKRILEITQGVAQLKVSLGRFEKVPLPLPPLAEQEQIVAEVERRLSIIAQAEVAIEASLKRIERARQSILEMAFSGRLVPQDPEDEPASLLLERIQAERKQREQAELQRRKEAGMSTTRGPRKKKSANTQQRPLLDVLVEAQKPLVPDDLYRRAGLRPDEVEQVEDFFDETREEVVVTGRIEELREDKTQVTLKARSE